MSCFEEAKAKLDEYTKVTGQKEKAMAESVASQLVIFCRQSDEFAQAICQGGNFQECMNAVAKGVGNSISDIDAYKKAVQFYFPGADIKFKMLIVMSKYEESSEHKSVSDGILVDLNDYL